METPRTRPSHTTQQHLGLNPTLDECQVFGFAGGIVSLFSTASPVRSGPNQDSLGIIPLSSSDGVIAIADGAGGHPAGDRASATAIQAMAQTVGDSGAESDRGRESILDAFESANQEIMSWGIGAATTLTALEIYRGRVRPYHCGDSAIMVVGQRGRIKLRTVPHSPVGHAIEAGILAEDESLHHDDLHVVSNSLGSNDMRIELGTQLELAQKDTVIVASDGLFDNLYADEIIELVRTGPIDEAVEAIAHKAQARMTTPSESEGPESPPCKPDDLTVVLYRPT